MIENVTEGPRDAIFTVESIKPQRSISFQDEEDFLFESNDRSSIVENSDKKVPLLRKKEKVCLCVFAITFLAALIVVEIFLYLFWDPAELDENRTNFDFSEYADIMRKWFCKNGCKYFLEIFILFSAQLKMDKSYVQSFFQNYFIS